MRRFAYSLWLQRSYSSKIVCRSNVTPPTWCWNARSHASTGIDRGGVAEIQRVLGLPVGDLQEMDLDILDSIFEKSYTDDTSCRSAFQLLDRINTESKLQKEGSLSPGYVHMQCRTTLQNWRNQYLSSEDREVMLQPSEVFNMARKWNLDANFVTETQAFGTILEVAAKNKSNPNEGVYLCESILEWMLKEMEGQQYHDVRPNARAIATVMKAWASSDHPDATNRVEAWLDQLQELHNQGWPDTKPETAVYNILLHALAKSGEVTKAEQVLQSMLRDDDIADPDQISFSTMLLAYTNEKTLDGMDRAEELLQQMLELFHSGMDTAKPNIVAFTTVMNGYAELALAEPVESLLNKLEDLYQQSMDPDWKVDIQAYNTLLKAFSRAGEPQKADTLLDNLLANPTIQVNEITFNSVISSWAQDGKADEAEAVLSRMHETFVSGSIDHRPSVKSYNIVLNAWANSKRSDAWQRAMDILDHMESLVNNGDESAKPNDRTWNTCLKCFAFCGKGNFHHAFKMLDAFYVAVAEGKVTGGPNLITWNTLLHGCLRNTTDDYRLQQIWQKMLADGVKPDIVTYTTILSCYARYATMQLDCRRDVENFVNHLFEDEDVIPNRATYLALVDVWIALGDLEKAEEVLNDLCRRKTQFEPDREAFHRVLRGLSAAKKPRRVESVVLLMQELYQKHSFVKLQPSVETYNVLLKAWADSRQRQAGERADLVLREMKVRGVDPDIVTYNNALNAWAKSRDPIALTKMEPLFLEMVLSGRSEIMPNDVSYRIWLRAIRDSSETDKQRRVNEVLKTMKIHKFEPSDETLVQVEESTKEVQTSGI